VQTKKGKHKLSPPQEGPYLIAEVLRPVAYRLQEINGTTFPNAWNIEQLRKFSTFVFKREEDGGKATVGMQADVGVRKGTWLLSRPHGF
jgi:hypothetical protein